MSRRVLMVAYHYPPLAGGSGQQRTLAFASHLQQYGWEPVILTVQPRAHEYVDTTGVPVPASYPVHRSFALDSSRHLAIAGRYPHWLAQPDRWISWWLSGVPAGIRLIRRYRPRLIWSTFPIATAHLIALSLREYSGLPWVADQRDPMFEADYPAHPLRHRLHRWIEQRVARKSSRIVCTSAGSCRQLQQRYPQRAAQQLVLIPNGYDEADFLPLRASQYPQQQGAPLVLLHSGVVYPSERDPAALFAALATLLQAGEISPASFRLRLRASEHHAQIVAMLTHYAGLETIVDLAPMLPRSEAIGEMSKVAGLLLLQGSSCNGQIPAKLYEYLRSGQPILALTDPQGDTAQLLRAAGIDTLARLDHVEDIRLALLRFLGLVRNQRAPLASKDFVAGLSRQHGSRQLARLFDSVDGEST